MTELTKRIAAIIEKHDDSGEPTWANERICRCGETYRVLLPHPLLSDHLAAALVEELGLREETRINPMSSAGLTFSRKTGEQTWHSDIRYDRRYITDWNPT